VKGAPSPGGRPIAYKEGVSKMWGRLLAFGPVAVFVALAVPGLALAQAGTLDTSFSGDGRVLTNFTTGDDAAIGVAVQPADGKIVAAGGAAGGGGRFALARYNPGGTPDSSFSGDGKVATNFTPGPESAFDMALQADGKIVAAGWAGGQGGRFALARYNTNGTLDAGFGGDGKVVTNFSPVADFAFGVAIQANGKIVAVGRAGGSGGRIAVARYNPNGRLDASFSGDGKVTTNFTAGDDRADLLALQTDGRIVAAGTADYFGRNARFALVRYRPNGALDASFSGDGKVTTNFTTGSDGAFAVAVQADGKIVAAGQARLTVALARYNPNGALDSSFSGDGKVRTDFTSGLDYADDVELQSDGKIVVAGAANFFGRDSRFALVRYNAGGTADASFSGDGRVVTNFTAGRDGALNLAVQPADGKIVAAGFASGGGGRFALARYLAS
jgi:uncharacterized delta-60 repeat protein